MDCLYYLLKVTASAISSGHINVSRALVKFINFEFK